MSLLARSKIPNIRLYIGAFLHGLFRQSAFHGSNPSDAYFVNCGIVRIEFGCAPLKPTEFVVIELQQLARQVQA